MPRTIGQPEPSRSRAGLDRTPVVSHAASVRLPTYIAVGLLTVGGDAVPQPAAPPAPPSASTSTAPSASTSAAPATSTSAAPATRNKAGVDWLDWGTGLSMAAQQKKPVLVQFYTTWCGYCRQMEQSTFKDPTVLRALVETINVRVDAEETVDRTGGFNGLDLATRHKITVYPTLMVLRADGSVLSRVDGMMATRPFLMWLNLSLAQNMAPVPESSPNISPLPSAPAPSEGR